MAGAIEIQNQLRRWLNSQQTLREFEDWFVPATWGTSLSRGVDEADLTESIDMNLALYTQGDIDLAELRLEFEKLAADNKQSIQETPVSEFQGSR